MPIRSWWWFRVNTTPACNRWEFTVSAPVVGVFLRREPVVQWRVAGQIGRTRGPNGWNTGWTGMVVWVGPWACEIRLSLRRRGGWKPRRDQIMSIDPSTGGR